MTAHDEALRSFLRHFVATNDWATWNVIADHFMEQDDQLGADAALWILQDRKFPMRFDPKKEKSDYSWWSYGGLANCRTHHIPSDLALIMSGYYRLVYYQGAAIEDAYLALIDCYRINGGNTD